ncbi:hypothetical protein BJX99DRAFT_247701 [Aspergillus californicus]
MSSPLGLQSTASLFSEDILKYHLGLLGTNTARHPADEASLAPIIASTALRHLLDNTSPKDDVDSLQFGLLAGSREKGSRKSHTLACMLEACLIRSPLDRLASPLTGVVFHYDTFIADTVGSPCEAAFLASHSAVSVRVLCAPTNIMTIRKNYARLNIPRVLREMRIIQQTTGGGFDYQDFKRRVNKCGFTPGQLGPLIQRMETLESFMPSSQTRGFTSKGGRLLVGGTDWKPSPGRLTIVDLSCPCISPETACSLFNICLGIFLQQDADVGRVFALDEAHKYMNSSPEATVFTDIILSAVRLQRHLGVRVIVSTQEPTISTALLVHRFTSPEWLQILRHHLAAAAKDTITSGGNTVSDQTSTEANTLGEKQTPATLFDRIVRLKVGEALIFAPSAIIGVSEGHDDGIVFPRLGGDNLEIMVRGGLRTVERVFFRYSWLHLV